MIGHLRDLILTIIHNSDNYRRRGMAFTGVSARVLTTIVMRELSPETYNSFGGCGVSFEAPDDVQALAAQQGVETILNELVTDGRLTTYDGLDDFGELAVCYRESTVLERLGGID